jgi:DegV family protein with EDD domain
MSEQARRPVKIVTDSTADIPPEIAAELGIEVVPLRVEFGNTSYRDGVDLNGEALYHLLRESPTLPTTSQPSLGELQQVYHRLTAEGYDVVSVHVSSGLSGTYNVAVLAAESEDEDERPGTGHVAVVDSQALSMCVGWLAIFGARAALAGADQAQVVALLEEMRHRVRILGLLDTLEYVQRGGRLGVASAFLGTMLAIKPILHMKQGTAQPMEKVRTKPRALQRLVEITAGFGPLEALAVMHGDAPDEAAQLVDMLAPIYPRHEILVGHIGAGLGVHVGPRAVGVCCVLAKN